jgi:hypothetical protein
MGGCLFWNMILSISSLFYLLIREVHSSIFSFRKLVQGDKYRILKLHEATNKGVLVFVGIGVGVAVGRVLGLGFSLGFGLGFGLAPSAPYFSYAPYFT